MMITIIIIIIVAIMMIGENVKIYTSLVVIMYFYIKKISGGERERR